MLRWKSAQHLPVMRIGTSITVLETEGKCAQWVDGEGVRRPAVQTPTTERQQQDNRRGPTGKTHVWCVCQPSGSCRSASPEPALGASPGEGQRGRTHPTLAVRPRACLWSSPPCQAQALLAMPRWRSARRWPSNAGKPQWPQSNCALREDADRDCWSGGPGFLPQRQQFPSGSLSVVQEVNLVPGQLVTHP